MSQIPISLPVAVKATDKAVIDFSRNCIRPILGLLENPVHMQHGNRKKLQRNTKYYNLLY